MRVCPAHYQEVYLGKDTMKVRVALFIVYGRYGSYFMSSYSTIARE